MGHAELLDRDEPAALASFRAAAYELAMSGRHRNATTIAIALERQGVDCALRIVGADFLFEAQLNEICRQHYAGPPDKTTLPNVTSNDHGVEIACALADSGWCSSMACPVVGRIDVDGVEVTDRAVCV